MQVTSSTNHSDPANPTPDNELREFAHHLANIHGANVGLDHTQKTAKKSRLLKADLLEHLNVWEQVLHTANAIFKKVPSNDLPVSRAGEWILDNFYVVKQTFRQIKEDLPVNFLNQLPKLNGTLLLGHPRIFALIWEWLGYTQSQLDLTQAVAFVQDYQEITPLTIGELWALPTMLRIGILERLVYATAELTEIDVPKGLSEIPSQFASSALANDTVVANCFHSLRLLATTDWKVFFDQTSLVEKILRDDPAGIYVRMDFDTRNSYRSVVEELTRYSTLSEEEVALEAVDLARSAKGKSSDRRTHVGFYLLDAGRPMLEARNPLPAGNPCPYSPCPPYNAYGHISGKHCYFFVAVCDRAAYLCYSFRWFALPKYYCWHPGVWIGFRGRHNTCKLDCDSSHQTQEFTAHGFFGGYPDRQQDDCCCP